MRRAALGAFAAVIACAAGITAVACSSASSAPSVTFAPLASPTPSPPEPTPLPATWLAGLHAPHAGQPVLLSCLDKDRDGYLTGNDDPRFAGLTIQLEQHQSCVGPGMHADFYADDTSELSCDGPPPLLAVLVGGGGNDLLDAKSGESIGLIDIMNQLQPQLEASGVHVAVMLASAAITGAVPAQGSMERYLEHEIAARLDATPCLRMAIVGHSHGGVTVTDVLATLEDRFAGRVYGVLLDRTTVIYDGDTQSMPVTAPVLNIYQLNEGWHGVAIDQPNITNVDQTAEYAPLAPSDGGGGLARVSHKTLDDAVDAQHRIVDAITSWAIGP